MRQLIGKRLIAIGLDASSDVLAHAARLGARERLPNLVLLRELVEQLTLEAILTKSPSTSRVDRCDIGGRRPGHLLRFVRGSAPA